MAEHKALIGIGQDNRHPDRVRPPGANDEKIIGQVKKIIDSVLHIMIGW